MSNETERPSRRFFGLGNFVPRAILYLKGDTGARGPQGPQGEKGDKGDAATVAAGTTTTLPAGSSASVTNSGTSAAAVFDFAIPQGATGPTGPQGPQGQKGDTGAAGKDGKDGADGAAATIAVGTVTTLDAGASATVTNAGTSAAAVFNFGIPKGAKGDTGATGQTGAAGAAATIAVGTVTTLDAGASATVTNAGTSAAAVFNFGIPKGAKGDTGATGAQGPQGPKGDPAATIVSPDGRTEVAATNSGTATISRSSLGNASVTFAPGYSITYDQNTYTAPPSGETIELFGPITSTAANGVYWVPAAYKDATDFDPSAQEVWVLYAQSGETPSTLMYGTGPYYNVGDWGTAAPTLELDTGTASGDAPTMARAVATTTKTVATTDEIPAAQVNADWNASSGVAQILNKPTIPDVSGKADAASLAPAFSASSTYAVGDYVTYEGLLYKCTTAVSTAGAWNAANWTAVSAMAEMPAPITVDSAMSSSSTNPVQNKVVDATIKLRVPWSRDNYGAGYTALTIGDRKNPPVGSIQEDTGVNSVIVGNNCRAYGLNSFSQGTNCDAGNSASHAEGNATTASGNTAHAEGYLTTAAGNISHAEGLSTYAAGRPSHAEGSETTAAGIASHADGYRAVTAASGNGSGASTPHDYAFAWQGVSTGGYYRSHGAGTYNINPVPASGSTDPATGFWIGETKLSDYVRYSFASPTPTVSGTSATVACEDRAINDFTVATGITSLTITPPAAVTGRARDFFCRVTLTDSSLPTVTLSGATIDIGASEVAGMAQGVNLLMFTEIASGHWLASRRSAS